MLTKQTLIIIAIVVIILVIISTNIKQIEHFNPYYNRFNPTFFNNGNITGYNVEITRFEPRNIRYNPGYSDYLYIPKHEYLKNVMDGPNFTPFITPSISEYCVNQWIQETGNLDLAIQSCSVPPSISESIPFY